MKGIVANLNLKRGDAIRVDWIQKDIEKTNSGLKKKLSEFFIVGKYIGKVKNHHIKVKLCYSSSPYISEDDGDKTFDIKKLQNDIKNKEKLKDELKNDTPSEWRFYYTGIEKLPVKEAMLYDI